MSEHLLSIVSGDYALVGGRQIRVRIDHTLGPKDDEYIYEDREIVVNGNHAAFRVAELLDQTSSIKKSEADDNVLWPAQTVHITKCVCLAWAKLHYDETGRWEEWEARYQKLHGSITESLLGTLTA